MTERPYSLTQVVPDGALIGPRWMLHAIKVAQHVGPAFALWCLTGRPLLSALLGGPALYAAILAHKLYVRNRPNWLDWLHDALLACLPVAGALIASHRPLEGWLLFAICLSGWAILHPYATP